MLLVGPPGSGEPLRRRIGNGNDWNEKRRRWRFDAKEGERWGAVWWYGFLVHQMQKAGPTFIKVCVVFSLYMIDTNLFLSSLNGQHPEQISSQTCYARRWACCIRVENRIL